LLGRRHPDLLSSKNAPDLFLPNFLRIADAYVQACVQSKGLIQSRQEPKRHTLWEVRIARNLGCVPVTGACVHNSTKWTKGGPRGTAVTLIDDEKSSVKVKVAAGTLPGTFWLQAQPETTCKCKGPDDIVRDCSDQPEKVTINII